MKSKRASWLVLPVHLTALTAALTLLTSPLSGKQPQKPAIVDVATLIDDDAAGDPAPLMAALGHVHVATDAALLRARLATMRLDSRRATRALDTYFAARDPDPRRQAIAWTIRAEVAFADGDYATVVAAVEAWQRLPESARRIGEAENHAQMLEIARLLAKEPRQMIAARARGTVPTARDKAGLVRAVVTINERTQDAVLDTGANLSVISASAAKRLKLRILKGAVGVGSATSQRVETRLAMADRLTVAGVELSHVAFLVMEDEQLKFPVAGGYQIDAIIGFPVFRALGRVRFDWADNLALGSSATPVPAGHNLRIGGNDLYVLSQINGVDAALHIDTGATASGLTSRFAKLHPSLLTGLKTESEQVMGAGGKVLTQRTMVLKPATITIGARSITLPRIAIVTDPPEGQEEKRLGAIGQDVLSGFEFYIIDFDRMSFALGPSRR